MERKRRPIVIAMFNDKVRVGKSTTAVNIAFGLAKRNYKVLLADCDPTGTVTTWATDSKGSEKCGNFFDFMELKTPSLIRSLDKIKIGYDIVILDGSPGFSDRTSPTINYSDLIVIPVSPSQTDIDSIKSVKETLDDRHKITPGKPDVCLLVTKAHANRLSSKQIDEQLQRYDYQILRARTYDREHYKTTLGIGDTVFSKGDRQAATEMGAIIDELIEKYIDRLTQ